MKQIDRRAFFAAFAAPAMLRGADRNEIRVEEIQHSYEDFLYRTPYQFGGREVDRVTLLNVECRVRGRNGKVARGFASMTMGNMWAWPSRTMNYDQTLTAMKLLADRIRSTTAAHPEYGHPIDINAALEPAYLQAAADASKSLPDSIPKLCTLLVASPFDSAIHDAFGKLHRRNCYSTYGPDLLPRDLSHYLGSDFRGEHLNRYVLEKAQPRVPLYHSVGAGDPIVEADIRKRLSDGMPETLPDWIRHNGLTHIKIKLNGADVKTDVERVAAIHRAASETQRARGLPKWNYCLDFNERVPNVDALMEFLRLLPERAPGALDFVQYIEQPTARDLKANRSNVMHAAAKIKPVVIDESLTDVESLLLAREMGYTGVALKACKGQTQAMLMSAVGQKHGMFLCVQDLTCPGASLIHSVGLAAHTKGAAGVEANARQYVPAANKPWEARFPGIFRVTDGSMRTRELGGRGLSAVR
jgi:L-alanine-DL-glutamate epimerase-like enolase superfamily enzyme